MRRTKIIATLGPRTEDAETIRALIAAGMNVARLNFAHGSPDSQRALFQMVRQTAADMNQNVGVLVDLPGPKIRTGRLERPEVELEDGAAVILTTEDLIGDQHRVSTSYHDLPNDVKPGDTILIADGTLELRVERVLPPEVYCTVVRGGLLGERKGLNLPGVNVSTPSLTEEDRAHLNLALELGADFVALSFVRRAEDLRSLRAIIEASGRQTMIVAKIERPEAIDAFDEILGQTDVVMVARGDLGVELPLENLPQLQKRVIRDCNDRGVPVITATQMLESMVHNPRPTRAEAADVANAIYDGTDAVMLSGETAVGRYPVHAVRVMAAIAREADRALAASPPREVLVRLRASSIRQGSFDDAVGQAALRIAEALKPVTIACLTKTGYTAGVIARYRPTAPIIAVTLSEEIQRRCSLIWGVTALIAEPGRYLIDEIYNTNTMAEAADYELLRHGLAQHGETVIILAGTPKSGGRTDLLLVHRVGEKSA